MLLMIDIHHRQDLDKFSFMHDLQHRVILDAKDDLYVAGTPWRHVIIV